MKPRERVLTALDHRESDRVPIDLGSCGPTGIHILAYQRLLKVLGIEEEIKIWDVIGQLAQPSETVLELVGADVRGIRVGGSVYDPDVFSQTELIDHWGIIWRRPEGGTCFHIAEYPLRNATRHDLEDYPWPDGTRADLVIFLAEKARYLCEETSYAVLGEFSGHVFERAQMVRGFDRFLLDLVTDRSFAEGLMDRILAIETDIVSTFLDAVGPFIDIIAFKDDIGMQAGPVISPAMFRDMVKPRLGKLVEVIRSKTRAKVWFHSCGSVYYAIPDLLDIGIDILNPVQVMARDMDTARLKRQFGNNLCFWGGVDTQQVLPFGPPEDVKSEVKRRVSDLAPGGGYVLASVHNIEADVPGENIWAMYQAAQQYGHYPLTVHRSKTLLKTD
jgi:uroporphyrinogen decarboxylase